MRQQQEQLQHSFSFRQSSSSSHMSKQGQTSHDIMLKMPQLLPQLEMLRMMNEYEKCHMKNELKSNARAPAEESNSLWIHVHH